MDQSQLEQRLSRISTHWSVLRQAHQGPKEAAAAAQQELMERYCGAVYRYLLSAVRDSHTAEDLTQEFALRFVRGRFRHADPGRGRFRDYVKTSLFHLVDDYRRRQRKQPRPLALGPGIEPAAESCEPCDADQAFLDSWREELLARVWQALAALQQKTSQPFHAVLQLHVQHPDLTSPQMAEQLTAHLQRPFTASAVRQTLHRARQRFAELVLEETARSLGTSEPGRLEQELADLNLLKYCQPAMNKRAGGS
jgi:RNA polymerase sigma-70 factor (ECF subfamily)